MNRGEIIKEFNIAMNLYRNDKYRECQDILLELYKKEKRNKYILFQLGKVYLRLGDKGIAKKFFRECIKYFPRNVHPRLELGKMYSNQGNYEKAELQFNKCLEIDDKNMAVMVELGRTYMLEGKFKAAEAIFIQAINIDSKNCNYAIIELGMLYEKQGKYEAAEVLFKKCIEKDINKDITMVHLGKLYVKQGRYKEAEEQFKSAADIEKNTNEYAMFELSKLHILQGKNNEAKDELEECIKICDDGNPNVRYKLGKVFLNLKKYKQAEQEFKKVIEMSPNMEKFAKAQLAYIYAIQGADEKSQELYKYLFKNIDEESYTPQKRLEHISEHINNNLSKPLHGVFTINPLELLNKLDFNKAKKYHGYMVDIYRFKVENCGYEGGRDGSGQVLNHVTLITLPNDKTKIITMFPSKEIKLPEKNKEDREQKSLNVFRQVRNKVRSKNEEKEER